MFCVGGVYGCLFVGDALVARGRCVRDRFMARRCLCKKLCVVHENLHVRKIFLLLLAPAWCMDVCRNVDSFPFRQIFALPICPTFRRGHAEYFRRPCMCVSVCVHVAVLINILSFMLHENRAQAINHGPHDELRSNR